METIKVLMERLEKLLKTGNVNMEDQSFLRTWDHNKDELEAVTVVGKILEEMYKLKLDMRVFQGRLSTAIFRDKSTRTRFSFASACAMLGLVNQELDESKSQVSHGETVRETANMISFLTEVIGIRDDLFVGEGHTYQKQVDQALKQGYEEDVLPQRTTVVNLQCDEDHPTQSLADLMHLIDVYGDLEKLKGKKIAMTWAYSPSYGKPLSVPQAIVSLMPRFGADVVLAHPPGWELLPHVMEEAEKNAKEGGGSLKVVDSMEEAFKDADVVYPKSWGSNLLMKKRGDMIREGKANEADLREEEKKSLQDSQKYKHWECTRKMMDLTKDKKALYMHCLPADITDVSCKEGEVSQEVFDQYRVPTYKEAAHKPYVIASMILLNRFKNVHSVFEEILKK